MIKSGEVLVMTKERKFEEVFSGYLMRVNTRAFFIALTVSLFFLLSSHDLMARRRSSYSHYIRPGKTFNMPSIGLKGKLIRDAKAAPIASIDERILTQKFSDGKINKITAFFPEDLWLRDQIAGTWKHPLCTISIYRMTLPPPADLASICTLNGHDYVLKASYEAWEKNIDVADLDWSDENISKWLQYMCKKNFENSPKIIRRGTRNATTRRFIPDNDDQSDLFYVVTSSSSPKTPFLIRYEFAPGGANKKNLKVVLQSLNSMTFSKPKEVKDSSKRKKISIKRTSKRKKGGVERSPEYLASKRAVIDSIKNMRNWWYVETDNFIMVADIKSQATAKALALNLERSRNLYTKIFPLKKPLRSVSVARMFATREEYLNYVGPDLQWSGGVWMSSRKELAVSPMSWGSRRETRKLMAQVTLHEAFHQYIYFATGERQNAVWFNEGMAQFFEGTEFKSSKIRIKPLTRKVPRIPALANKQNIEDMLKMPPVEFYGQNKNQNYNLAWGMLYFMLKGAPVMKGCAEYAEIPSKYYDAMIKTGNAMKATKIAWKGIDTYTFAQKFKAFWNSRKLMKRASKFNPLKKK